jgi:hypothetical protein
LPENVLQLVVNQRLSLANRSQFFYTGGLHAASTRELRAFLYHESSGFNIPVGAAMCTQGQRF